MLSSRRQGFCQDDHDGAQPFARQAQGTKEDTAGAQAGQGRAQDQSGTTHKMVPPIGTTQGRGARGADEGDAPLLPEEPKGLKPWMDKFKFKSEFELELFMSQKSSNGVA